MTLELNQVVGEIDEMGRLLADQARRQRQALPAARALLCYMAEEQEQWRVLAESPVGQEANCALPTHEPLSATFSAPRPPERAAVLAVDGSQIPPDPHGLALYYLINVGSLVYRHGSGQAPLAATDPSIAYAADTTGRLLTAEQLAARRDVAEIQKLADLAEAESGSGPVVALLDSTVGLHAWSSAIPAAEQEALAETYAAQLDRIRLAGAALAGVVSRSRAIGAIRLLNLARQDSSSGVPDLDPFLGLTDQMLWGSLQPGERSALLGRPGTDGVCFFYLNTDPPDWPQLAGVEAEPARIEVPPWVAQSREKLAWVHALVYDQCRINNGYPYALTRADELAIILNEEREALEAMIVQAMSRQGLPLPRLSRKAAQKRIARAPSRRRL
jgi:hypothetical protein